jgi:hypothetical protein
MGTFLVRPKEDYKLLGTDIQLDKTQEYHAIHATNQPDWEARCAIFVLEHGLEQGASLGFLLEGDDYEIVDEMERYWQHYREMD